MENATQPPARWNRARVEKYLLPYLRFCDAKRNSNVTDEQLDALQQTALDAFSACPEAYRQLARVYTRADDDLHRAWFGSIDCDDALLDDVFSMIEESLSVALTVQEPRLPDTPTPPQESTAKPTVAKARRAPSLSEDATLRALFLISRTQKDKDTGKLRVRRLDLLLPFLELCRCYDDTEKVECQARCRKALQVYRKDYTHAIAQYREQYPTNEDAASLLPETRQCLQLLEQMLDRLSYQINLDERREALEYERGGLGWFSAQRKREIDNALLDIDIEAVELKISDEEERLQAQLAPLQHQLEDMAEQLALSPVTAFGRKKQLKLGIKQTQERIREIENSSELDTLIAQRDALLKKKR